MSDIVLAIGVAGQERGKHIRYYFCPQGDCKVVEEDTV